MPDPQPAINAPQNRAVIFLVLTIKPGPEHAARTRRGCGELHPFRELRSGPRIAPSTPADVVFQIRAERMDMCFEGAARLMARLADGVTPVDEMHGFRYFDDRDLIGFVDGTENPSGLDSLAAGRHHRTHQVRRYRARRRGQAEFRAQRTD
jgi:deferrochelatase/peroxidase EfeB